VKKTTDKGNRGGNIETLDPLRREGMLISLRRTEKVFDWKNRAGGVCRGEEAPGRNKCAIARGESPSDSRKRKASWNMGRLKGKKSFRGGPQISGPQGKALGKKKNQKDEAGKE